MIQDIFIPSKIGSYYIFNKRVLGFEITTTAIQASLLYFSQNKVTVENSMTITLQDQNPHSIINGIKKIVTTIGKYDEVVTSLSSSAVVFKELVLPFIGREKIAMIVHYEVESLLPFSLEEAVIDFLITDENKEKSQTTILVAATLKSELENFTSYFEKAGVSLTHVTLDMFALYDFYRNTMYVAQAHTSLLLVDFGIDYIRMLYIEKGILKSVRLVPYGLAAMLSKIDGLAQALPNRSLEDILRKDIYNHDEQHHHTMLQCITDFSKQVTLSISFFQKNVKNFMMPSRIICLGIGTELLEFTDQATKLCQISCEILDMKRIAYRNNIYIQKKIKIDSSHCASLIITLSAAHYGDINFLSKMHHKADSNLLNKQLLVGLLLSLGILVYLYMYSNYDLKKWTIAYNKSKKEMVTMLKEQMDLDLKNIKRMSDVVLSAQDALQQTKKVCFSFSQSNNAFLHHLQELCSTIDKESLGLDLKKLSLHDKEVVLQGKVKDFDALQTFEEELMELPSFTLKNIPAELTFNVTLQVKEDHDKHEEKS